MAGQQAAGARHDVEEWSNRGQPAVQQRPNLARSPAGSVARGCAFRARTGGGVQAAGTPPPRPAPPRYATRTLSPLLDPPHAVRPPDLGGGGA